jgi:hypothetical protein
VTAAAEAPRREKMERRLKGRRRRRRRGMNVRCV